jgi:hypothetical protein
MQQIFLVCFWIFTLSLSGQQISGYFTVHDGDTLGGYHTDLNINDGVFTTYALMECPHGHELLNFKEYRQGYTERWYTLVTGQYHNGERAGEWYVCRGLPKCNQEFYLWCKTITYRGDTLEVLDFPFFNTMTTDSTYIRGKYLKFDDDAVPNWECFKKRCKVWREGERDTVDISLTKLDMTITLYDWDNLFK